LAGFGEFLFYEKVKLGLPLFDGRKAIDHMAGDCKISCPVKDAEVLGCRFRSFTFPRMIVLTPVYSGKSHYMRKTALCFPIRRGDLPGFRVSAIIPIYSGKPSLSQKTKTDPSHFPFL